jgi:hypothetical protein
MWQCREGLGVGLNTTPPLSDPAMERTRENSNDSEKTR